MASTYVNDLRLEEMATGDQSGTWGETTNTNLELISEAFSFGTEAITTNADTHTTSIADGATDPGRSMYLKYTGTLDSACTITIGPNTVSKMWFIENGTSGSQNIIISQGSGANITIPPGDVKVVYSDGAGSGAAVVDAFASLSVVDLKVQDDLTVTGDITGTLATAAQPNITSVGILTGLTITGSTLVSDDQTNDWIKQEVSGTTSTISLGNTESTGGTAQWSYNRSTGNLSGNIGAAAGTNFMTVEGTGNIGFGTDSPDGKVHIFSSSAGTVSAASDANNLVLESSANVGMTLLTGNSSVARIRFGDADSNARGNIFYNHSNDSLGIQTAASTAMTIESSGNVGIGTTAASGRLHVNKNGTAQTIALFSSDLGTNDRNFSIRSPASDSASEPFEFSTGNSFQFTIDGGAALNVASDKNVGILNTDPNAQLHIGDANVEGDATNPALQIGGTTTYRLGLYTQAERGVIDCPNGDDGLDFRVKTAGLAMRVLATTGGILVKGTSAFGTSAGTANDITVGMTGTNTTGIKFDTASTAVSGNARVYLVENKAGDRLSFSTGAGTEIMAMVHEGNVGIGEDNPLQKLHVNSGTGNSAAIFESTDSTSQIWLKDSASSTTYQTGIGCVGDNLLFNNGGEKMRIDSSGNLLVGTTDSFPGDGDTNTGVSLTASGSAAFSRDGFRVVSINRNTSDGTLIEFNKGGSAVGSIGTLGGHLTIGNSDTGIIFQDGEDNIQPLNLTTNAARDAAIDLGSSSNRFKDIHLRGSVYADLVRGYADTDTYVNFAGSNVLGFITGASERMRIDSSGSLIIGKTSTTNNNTAGIYMLGSGAIVATRSSDIAALFNRTSSDGQVVLLRRQNVTVGSISVTGSATTYATSSDARLKNVTGSARGLEVINELNPVAYNWKADGQADEGLIAQEVLDIVPNAVSGSEEDMYQMDYSKLVVHLVAGMKEQQTIIDDLKTRIEALEA